MFLKVAVNVMVQILEYQSLINSLLKNKQHLIKRVAMLRYSAKQGFYRDHLPFEPFCEVSVVINKLAMSIHIILLAVWICILSFPGLKREQLIVKLIQLNQ